MRFRWRMRTGILAVGLGLGCLAAVPAAGAAGARGPAAEWPGDASVRTADEKDFFGENLSGLSFGSGDGGGDADVLWAVKNGPGTLYRLVPDGENWVPDPSGGWADGKALHYADGGGDADAEGVVATPEGVFAATERDNDEEDESSQRILRFDTGSGSGDSLDAAEEWDLTADLPDSEPNAGIEAISWVPDAYLTAHGFKDQRTGGSYDPGGYPGHGGGLYLVGLESTGAVYAYALGEDGDATRVADFPTGFEAVMDLEFEPGTGRLWAACDDTCDGQTATLGIEDGAFTVDQVLDRPGDMPNLNNEGFAIAPAAACAGGRLPVLWSDDGGEDGHALRAGSLTC